MKNCEIIGNINKIETFSTIDGPGIRSVVFMQGCPLRCLYCHNPETWNINEGKKYTVKKLVSFLKKYKNYYGNNGGVTFSGGEPLLQSKYLIEVIKELKKDNIHVALDTSGVGYDYEELIDLVDLIILDIKGIGTKNFKNITGKDDELFLKFLELIQNKNKELWIRSVIIPGINNNKEYILELKKHISSIKNIGKIELLPYHTIGVNKYKKLKLDYPLKDLEALDKEECDKLYELLIKE